ncbi:MAG: hypothetical protein IJK18_04820 [Clostridia bacterium]|nr:hypothetical protein [Clostridia bacterium]
MENASKALIIAGAILLSILIISLGIVVVNNTRTTIDKANVNQQEVSTFNSQFEAYVGNKRTMSDVRAVAALVFSNNGAQNQNKTNHTVSFTYGGTAKTSIPTDLENGKTYAIDVTYGDDGYITTVAVTY